MTHDTWSESYWQLMALQRKPRFWFTRSFDTWLPFLGDDEYRRRTLVLGTPITGHVVIAAPWRCRCRDCRDDIARLRAIVDAG